jgi:hypothetical protein
VRMRGETNFIPISEPSCFYLSSILNQFNRLESNPNPVQQQNAKRIPQNDVANQGSSLGDCLSEAGVTWGVWRCTLKCKIIQPQMVFAGLQVGVTPTFVDYSHSSAKRRLTRHIVVFSLMARSTAGD